jgi:hypothetical protein
MTYFISVSEVSTFSCVSEQILVPFLTIGRDACACHKDMCVTFLLSM